MRGSATAHSAISPAPRLQYSGGEIHRAAKLAGMSRATFSRKRKRLGS